MSACPDKSFSSIMEQVRDAGKKSDTHLSHAQNNELTKLLNLLRTCKNSSGTLSISMDGKPE